MKLGMSLLNKDRDLYYVSLGYLTNTFDDWTIQLQGLFSARLAPFDIRLKSIQPHLSAIGLTVPILPSFLPFFSHL